MSEPAWSDGDEATVPVAGGDLAVTRWGNGTGTPVLAVHGITANGHSFARTAAELAGRQGPASWLRTCAAAAAVAACQARTG